MPLYRVAPTGQLPHTIDLIQRQSAPRFANEVERDQQYPDPELGALAVINTTLQVFNGTGWIPVGGGQPTLINHLQDVDARFPPDGAVLTWSSAAQAWGWSMPATPEPPGPVCDDFDRPDGAIGANWVGTIIPAWNDTQSLMTIDDGAAVGPTSDPSTTAPWLGNSVRWHAATAPKIEAEIEWTGDKFYLYLFTNADAAGGSCWLAEISYEIGTPVQTFAQIAGFPPGDTSGTYFDSEYVAGFSVSSPFTARFESDPVTHVHSIYIDDVLLFSYTATAAPALAITGDYVGFGTDWGAVNDTTASPRFLRVCVGDGT